MEKLTYFINKSLEKLSTSWNQIINQTPDRKVFFIAFDFLFAVIYAIIVFCLCIPIYFLLKLIIRLFKSLFKPNLPLLPDENQLINYVIHYVYTAVKDVGNLLDVDVPYFKEIIKGNPTVSYQDFSYQGYILKIPIVNAIIPKKDIQKSIDTKTLEYYRNLLQQSINGALEYSNIYPMPYNQKMIPNIVIDECIDTGTHLWICAIFPFHEYVVDYILRPRTEVLQKPIQPIHQVTETEEEIAIALDKDYYDKGVSRPILWKWKNAAHMVITGPSGSGKSIAVLVIINEIAKQFKNLKLWVLDYKNSGDLDVLNDCQNLYTFDNCVEGFNNFFKTFEARQLGDDSSRDFILLVFDEWASYINNLDKKMAEEEKKKMATLLMLGRSFNIHILVSQQRADASYFNTARDNFSVVIGLGNLSKESISMLFQDYKDSVLPNCQQGTGYMLMDGVGFKSIKIPYVSDINGIKNDIRKALI